MINDYTTNFSDPFNSFRTTQNELTLKLELTLIDIQCFDKKTL